MHQRDIVHDVLTFFISLTLKLPAHIPISCTVLQRILENGDKKPYRRG